MSKVIPHLLALLAFIAAAPLRLPAQEAGADLNIQGEYVGKMRDADFALQIIALGGGKYDAVVCTGGLPGVAHSPQRSARQVITCAASEEGLKFGGNGWTGTLKNQTVELEDIKGASIGKLTRTERRSPTLGSPPPEGAVILFDGKNVDLWEKGARMTEDGLLMQGCKSKAEFGDCKVHLEFLLPFMPEARGQGRGNSGVYLAGRYEVQILDSFGLNGEHNECGGIYKIARPKVNMCLPPGQWQSYDIDYVAPRFDEKGTKVSDAQLTVKHNGVLIHDKTPVPGPTTSAPIADNGPLGPLYLQDHGNQVRFRNVWVLPTK